MNLFVSSRVQCSVGLLAFVLCLSQRLPAADTNAFLESWFAAQADVQTWSAALVQTRTLKALKDPLQATGRLWYAAPDQFRWQLGDPPQTIALRQSNEMLVVYPRLRRAERYALSESGREPWRDALALLDAGFPSNRKAFDQRFRLLSLDHTSTVAVVTLEPRSATARRFMQAIRLTLQTNDFSMVANEVQFADGSLLRNDFTNTTLNAVLAPDVFQVPLPEGFKVVEMGKP
jgi:outer membrane lipoprotein-sorting protein